MRTHILLYSSATPVSAKRYVYTEVWLHVITDPTVKESNNPLSEFELRLGFENIGIHSYTVDGGVLIFGLKH